MLVPAANWLKYSFGMAMLTRGLESNNKSVLSKDFDDADFYEK